MDDNEISRLVEFADSAVYEYTGKRLSPNQRKLLKECLLEKKLEEIHIQRLSGKYICTRMAPKLWKLLSNALDKNIHKMNVSRILEDELKSLQDKPLRSQKAKSKAKTRLSDRVARRCTASASGLTVVNPTLFSRAIWKFSSEHEREQAQANGSQWEEVGQNSPKATTLLGGNTPRSSKLKKFMKSGLPLLMGLGVLGSWYGLYWLADWYGVKSHLAGNLPQAQFVYNWALKINFIDLWTAETHYSLGEVYEDQQNYKQAQAQYQLAIEGGLIHAYNNQARLYILNGNYSAAVALLQVSIPLTTNEEPRTRYSFFKNLGWARLEQGSVEEAQIQLEQAIALEGDRSAAYCLLAQVLERQGEKKQAVSHWENCLAYTHLPRTPEEDKWIRLGQQRLKAAYGEFK